jgi:pimeloyl-ACP methyl ester carboxylesterase
MIEMIETRDVRSTDGALLRGCRRMNSRDSPVLMFNAVGIPSAIFDPIMNSLCGRHMVVTWESRGLPSPGHLGPAGFAYENHVDDAERIFSAFGLTRVHLVGWCSGADVAVLFALRHPTRVATLTLINGAYGFQDDGLSSEYEDSLTRLFEGFLRKPGAQNTIHRALLSLVASPMISDDPLEMQLRDILLYPFQTPDRLGVYARLCLAVKNGRRIDTFEQIRAPTLYISALGDPVQPYRSSVHAHELTPGSQLRILAEGDHNILYTRAEVAGFVDDFIDS